jgi:hypothetical protein
MVAHPAATGPAFGVADAIARGIEVRIRVKSPDLKSKPANQLAPSPCVLAP